MIVGEGTGIASNQVHDLTHGPSHNKRHDSDSAKSSAMFTTHQFLGRTIVAFLLIQILLGWWHHVTFVRIRARTWVSYAHIWLGRMEMIGGCGIGMALTGYDSLSIEMVAGFILMEALAVTFWCFYRQQLPARKMSNV